MFKKTLVAAALATATMGASAWQVAQNETSSLEVYGVTAISIATTFKGDEDNSGKAKGDDTGYALDNESRVGFRGHKDLADNLTGFIQIEGGWVDPSFKQGGGGTLGARDTFVGLKGTWGKAQFGRMLTPMYEIVDWPFSNPGMGSVFDGNDDITQSPSYASGIHRDRHSDQLQYQMPTMGDFNAKVTIGRGDNSAHGNYFFGASASLPISIVTLMAGVESETNREDKGGVYDSFAAIGAASIALPGGFSIKQAVKYGSADYDNATEANTQLWSSTIGEYWAGDFGLRLGYAMAFDAEVNGKTLEDSADSVISLQPMYVIGGAVFYARVRSTTMNSDDSDITARLGLEYGF